MAIMFMRRRAAWTRVYRGHHPQARREARCASTGSGPGPRPVQGTCVQAVCEVHRGERELEHLCLLLTSCIIGQRRPAGDTDPVETLRRHNALR